MVWGIWSENSRGSYNKWDAISRSTVEVGFSILIFCYHTGDMDVTYLCFYLFLSVYIKTALIDYHAKMIIGFLKF
jgi:hypothetical protein